VSITLVMAAVFFPVGFMGGPSGVFFQQFAYTLATAILISALNALTLTPALCALLLRRSDAHPTPTTAADAVADASIKKERGFKGFKSRFFSAFNTGFATVTNQYIGSLRFLIARKWLAIGGLAFVTAVGIWLMNRTPSS